MRIPKSLSYSALSLFEKNPEEFYIRYLAQKPAPRLPQESPMAVGASFDARVKAALHEALFGAGSDPQFEFETIFESQVEPQCRDFALEAGRHVFECYKLTGAYDELLTLLRASVQRPRFEFKLDGTIAGAPFTGKPDCRFVLDYGQGPVHCILDWKVRGYCSKHGASPSKGYMLCRDAYTCEKPSRSHGKEHPNYLAMNHRGLTINAGYLETCSDEYADQLCVYGWLLGERPGDENVVCMIEEIVAKYTGEKPLLRVANHRGRVKADYQMKLMERVARAWQAVASGHVFTTMTREESDARCQVLEETAVGMEGNNELDQWFNKMARPAFF